MKKALIVYGGWDGHEPEKTSFRFKKILEAEGFNVTLCQDHAILGDQGKLLTFDLFIPMWTQGELLDDHVYNISDAVENGMGVAGCHGGMCDAFRNNVEWQFVTGSQWVAHSGEKYYHHCSVLPEDGIFKDPVPDGAFQIKYRVNIRHQSSSPIVEGIDDFDLYSEQYYLHVDPAVDVLATTLIIDSRGPHTPNGIVAMPVVYTKRWGKGRVFYNSLGHHNSVWDIPQAAELMRRGMRWAARK